MSLWNPHVCTPTGLMLPQTAPPALRIIEGEATTDQLAAAQQAFYKFCMHSRLSAVPNPTEIGRLPDGSRYRITDIAGVRTMELWFEDAQSTAGIGVTLESEMWILRPPGKPLLPALGEWAAEKVETINGGVVFVFTGGKGYFVESSEGISRGNKKLSDSILAATDARFIMATTSFPTSNPFVGNSAVNQVKVIGNKLRLGMRSVEKNTPSQSIKTSDHNLPEITEGNGWGMVTSNSSGSSIMVCRIATDPDASLEGNLPSRVCAAGEMAYSNPGGGYPSTVEIVGFQLLAIDEMERLPKSNNGQAPEKSFWSKSKDLRAREYTVTLSNPNPIATSPTFTLPAIEYINKSSYREEAKFEATSIYRAYIGSDGRIVMDGLKRHDFAIINSAINNSAGGYEYDTWVNYRYDRNSSKIISINRFDEVLFSGEQSAKIFTMNIYYSYSHDNDSHAETHFSGYIYDGDGNIKGFDFASTARFASLTTNNCKIERTEDAIILFDDQFNVLVKAKIKLIFNRSLREGIAPMSGSSGDVNFVHLYDVALNRGTYDWPRVDELNASTSSTVTLEIIHKEAHTAAILDAPVWLEAEASRLLLDLFDEVDRAGVSRSFVDGVEPEDNTGFRKNRFDKETPFTELMNRVFSEQLSGVMYAKDPKTGAGFLSFQWGGVPHNYVVGPWGVASSASRTSIAHRTPVTALHSV